jgi:hypothetical protein
LESLERRKAWSLWKNWGLSVLCKGLGVLFLVKSFQLTISPRPFAAICVFSSRWFATCLPFSGGGPSAPYSPANGCTFFLMCLGLITYVHLSTLGVVIPLCHSQVHHLISMATGSL